MKRFSAGHLCGAIRLVPFDAPDHGFVPWISDEDRSPLSLLPAAIPGPGTTPIDRRTARFSLPGRSSLERLFREHVIDIVQNETRYRRSV